MCSENWLDLKQDLGCGKRIRTQTDRQKKQTRTEPNEARGLEEKMTIAKVMRK